jgi:lysophospholipase L1-like esterase
VSAAGGVARIVFVNVCVPRPWAVLDNAVLADGVARHANVAVLADWNALATPHPEWFTSDQVHLNPGGATALAALIATYT